MSAGPDWSRIFEDLAWKTISATGGFHPTIISMAPGQESVMVMPSMDEHRAWECFVSKPMPRWLVTARIEKDYTLVRLVQHVGPNSTEERTTTIHDRPRK